MAVTAFVVLQLVVALLLLGIALVLSRSGFAERVNRSFSLILFLKALLLVCNQASTLVPAESLYWARVRGYIAIGLTFALYDFLLVYQGSRRGRSIRAPRLVGLVLLVATEAVYLARHELFFQYAPPEPFRLGALGVLYNLSVLGSGLLALWFAAAARAAGPDALRRFNQLFALGFAALAVTDGLAPYVTALQTGVPSLFRIAGPGVGPATAVALNLLAAPFGLLAAILVALHLRRLGEPSAARWSLLVPAVSLIATPSAFLIARPWAAALYALSQLQFPLLLGYAILKQNQPRIDPVRFDVRVRLGLSRGTLGAIFIAMFFIVSEASQNVIQEMFASRVPPLYAQLIGVLGAGLLVFALAPMQRLGDRMADSVLPDARPLSELTLRERTHVYEEQAEIAWADGSISAKERLLLDRLRERLSLPITVAAKIESDAARYSAG